MAARQVRYNFESGLLGTRISAEYSRGEAVFRSGNLSALAVVKDAVAREVPPPPPGPSRPRTAPPHAPPAPLAAKAPPARPAPRPPSAPPAARRPPSAPVPREEWLGRQRLGWTRADSAGP